MAWQLRLWWEQPAAARAVPSTAARTRARVAEPLAGSQQRLVVPRVHQYRRNLAVQPQVLRYGAGQEGGRGRAGAGGRLEPAAAPLQPSEGRPPAERRLTTHPTHTSTHGLQLHRQPASAHLVQEEQAGAEGVQAAGHQRVVDVIRGLPSGGPAAPAEGRREQTAAA